MSDKNNIFCVGCYKRFVARTYYQIYCSSACRSNHKSKFFKSHGHVCMNCSKQIPVIKGKMFCSAQCVDMFFYVGRAQSELYLYDEIRYANKKPRFRRFNNIVVDVLRFDKAGAI